MKKRFLTLFTIVLAAIFTAGGLTACAPPHRYAENWSYNDSEHWREITCIHAPYVDTVREPHSFDGTFCTICGYYKVTGGLSYSAIRNSNGDIIAYSVSGMGSAIGYYVGIPSTYEDKPVTRVEYDVFTVADEIVIPDSVKEIDTDGNVTGNHSLKRITVSSKNPYFASRDGILYDKQMTEMLYVPKVEGSVTIPDGVTTIPDSAFFNCGGLFEIFIPDSVTEIGNYAFTHCDNLNFTIYNGLKYLGSDNNPYRILISTEEYSLSEYSIHKDTKIIAGGAFQSTDLTEIEIPDGVISIGNSAFSGCDWIERITLPESLKIIGNSAFINCNNLININIPSGLEYLGKNSLNGCNSLEFNEFGGAYYLGNENEPEVVLYQKKSLDIIECTVSETTRFIYEQAFSYCQSLTEITLPDSVIQIGDGAFAQCLLLARVHLPDGLKEIPLSAFYCCYELREINFPSNLTTVGFYAFSDCSSLEEVILPDGLETIDTGAFAYCRSLKNVVVPLGVRTIKPDSFRGCSSLESITLPFVGNPEATDNLGLFGYIFGGSYENGSVPETLASVTVLGGTLGAFAFHNCENINDITLINVTEVGYGAFNNCSHLTQLDLGTAVKSIGEGAFFSCNSLYELVIPEGVEKIYEQTFNYCYMLNRLTLPSSIKSIADKSFESCSQLKDLYYNGTVSQWKKIERGVNSGLNNEYTEIHCTDGDTVFY